MSDNEKKKEAIDEMARRASGKIEEIKKATKELEELQESCKHPEMSIQNVGPKDGSTFKLMRVCDVCGKTLGYPSKEETDNWLEK